jgi:3',5'-cyclic AMP phosphodiesterase CpdA
MALRGWARATILVVAWVVAWASAFAVHAAPSPPAPQRIVAIGDLHGDHRAWRDVATAAGLMDRNGRWTGGRTVVVQTGDIVDRGPDSLKIIRELRRLETEAPRAGGRVIALVGNHEAMNVTGDLRYVHPGEYAAFRGPRSQALRDRYYSKHRRSIEDTARAGDPKLTDDQIRAAWERATPLGMIEHRQAWRPSGDVGAWVIRNPAVLKLADLLFVHGGVSGAYAELSIDEMNRRVAEALAAQDESDDAIINDPNGPLWYRGLVAREGAVPGEAERAIDQELTEVLRKQGARAIVIGHTPALKGVVISQAGRLVQIDTGISAHYGGAVSYLEIIGGRMIPRTVARSPVAAAGR